MQANTREAHAIESLLFAAEHSLALVGWQKKKHARAHAAAATQSTNLRVSSKNKNQLARRHEHASLKLRVCTPSAAS